MRRTKEEAEKTRQTVLEAALTLFSRDGYSRTTLSRIAREAGCSRGPIYWYFQNKDDLYEAVLAYSQEPLEALVDECRGMADRPLAALDHFLDQWLSLLANDRRYRQSFEILLNKTELTDAMSRTLARERQLTRAIVDLFATLIERAMAGGALRPGRIRRRPRLAGLHLPHGHYPGLAVRPRAVSAGGQDPVLPTPVLDPARPDLSPAGTGRGAVQNSFR